MAVLGNIKAAIIVTNPTYTIMKIGHLSDTHFTCAEVTTASNRFYLVSAYFQCSDNIQPYLDHLEYVLREVKGHKVIICVDANAKSTLWHSNSTDGRGEALEELILQNNLYIINKPSEHSTFDNARGKSNIDLTIATSTIYNQLKDWEILTDTTSSDHNMILTTIDIQVAENYKPKDTRFNTKKANWEKFEAIIQSEIQKIDIAVTQNSNSKDVETLSKEIVQIIHTASTKAIQKKNPFPEVRPMVEPKLVNPQDSSTTNKAQATESKRHSSTPAYKRTIQQNTKQIQIHNQNRKTKQLEKLRNIRRKRKSMGFYLQAPDSQTKNGKGV
ncbi:Retrovirus-related Pol polyprotein from type-1 retrotransposable element R1 (Fragment) [Anthophora plagiata]